MEKIDLVHNNKITQIELYKILSTSTVFQKMYGNDLMKKENSISFSNFDEKTYNDIIQYLETKDYVYSDNLKEIGDYLGIKELEHDNRMKITIEDKMIRFKLNGKFKVSYPATKESLRTLETLKKSIQHKEPVKLKVRLAVSIIKLSYTGEFLRITMIGTAQNETVSLKVKTKLISF